jgi:hypothetical protein
VDLSHQFRRNGPKALTSIQRSGRLHSTPSSCIANGALSFSFRVALFDGVSLIVKLSTPGQAKFDLGLPFVEVDLEGDQRQGLRLEPEIELGDLASVDEQLALAIGVVTSKARCELPRRDVEPEQPKLSVVDAGVRICELGLAFPKRLDF